MAMIDEAIVTIPDTATGINVDAVREAIARQAWAWFYVHANEQIISRKVLFWKVTIYVRDLEQLFVYLFGDPDR